MLQKKIQPIPMKAVGALAFGVTAYFGSFSPVPRQRKGQGPIFPSALLEPRAARSSNFIEIGQAVSFPGEDFADKRISGQNC